MRSPRPSCNVQSILCKHSNACAYELGFICVCALGACAMYEPINWSIRSARQNAKRSENKNWRSYALCTQMPVKLGFVYVLPYFVFNWHDSHECVCVCVCAQSVHTLHCFIICKRFLHIIWPFCLFPYVRGSVCFWSFCVFH